MSPAKDAVLGYHLQPASGEPIDVRVTFLAGGKGLRMDLPDYTYMVAIPESHSLTLVAPLYRTVAVLPWTEGPQPLFTLDERMKFTRKGEATVAGKRCTQWEGVLDANKNQFCITPDGLVLRNQFPDPQGRRNLIEAFVVRYQPVVLEDFVIPPGFDKVEGEPEGAPAR